MSMIFNLATYTYGYITEVSFQAFDWWRAWCDSICRTIYFLTKFLLNRNILTKLPDVGCAHTQDDPSFTAAQCMGMLCVDIVLYAVLAWYFDSILPKEWGVVRFVFVDVCFSQRMGVSNAPTYV